jgi:hypothetical protein
VTKLSEGQREALDILERLAATRQDLLTLSARPTMSDGNAVVSVRFPTKDLPRVEGGLPLADVEDFTIEISVVFPYLPPTISVSHSRFAGYPHVVGGNTLCVYRDPAREWSPNLGIIGFLNRVWDWLADAAMGRFDASTALFHPVGGVLHQSLGTPTVVVRVPIPAALVNRGLLFAGLEQRTPARLDLTGWHSSLRGAPQKLAAVILLPGPLVFGGGLTVNGLLARIARVGFPSVEHVIAHIYRVALQDQLGDPLYLVIGARNPVGHLPQDHHLLVARIEPPVADQLRMTARERFGKLGVGASFDQRDVPEGAQVRWCSISDERPSIATRRDASRPTSWYEGKHIELWGCGGIGSWIAEAIVRAGARRVVVRDPGIVTSGLHVRQNYTEVDVGANKAEALASRLTAISDRVKIEAHAEDVIILLARGGLPACDLIIDATINRTVAHLLERAATSSHPRPALAAIALDAPTATLGLLTVACPTWSGGPYDVERRTSTHILQASELEHFHIFWQDLADHQQVVPERGCSVPTFHGSTTDVMAIAATGLDLIARRLTADATGFDLFAVGHAALAVDVPHRHHSEPAPAAIEGQVKGRLAVRLDAAVENLILQGIEADQPTRWLLAGEYNQISLAIWIDEVVPVPSDIGPDEVDRVFAERRNVSQGISNYIGDVLHRELTLVGEASRQELQDALKAVKDAGGSLVIAVARRGQDVTITSHMVQM